MNPRSAPFVPSRLTARRTRAITVALLAVALLIRLAVVAHYQYTPIHDAGTYLNDAYQISVRGTYHDGNHAAGGTHGPSAYFAPAYPYLLSVADTITGGPAQGATTVDVARIMQALLGTVTVGLIGLIALDLFGAATALVALAIAAIYPVLVELDSVLVAENLLTVLELAAVYAALRAQRTQTPLRWVVATGVFTGLAALTHTNAALIAVPLAFAVKGAGTRSGYPLARAASRATSWARSIPAPAILLAVALLTVTPWCIRDAEVFHRFVPISTDEGITLAGTYNPTSATADPPYRWLYFSEVPSLAYLQHNSQLLTEVQLSDKLQSRALHYIGQHPLSPLSVAFHNTLRLLEFEGSTAWKESSASIGLNLGLAQIGVIGFWILLALALAGIRTQAIRGVPRWLWGVPLAMWLTVALVNGETPRFREPLDPFLILLAASAITAALTRFGYRGWFGGGSIARRGYGAGTA